MKVLTLWEPWASLICLGIKKIETRSWNSNYRGTLLIHSAMREVKKLEMEFIVASLEDAEVNIPQRLIKRDFKYGCINGVCQIQNIRPMNILEDEDEDNESSDFNIQSELELSLGLWKPGRYAWELAEPRELIPVPATGLQKLWNVPASGKGFIEGQLKALRYPKSNYPDEPIWIKGCDVGAANFIESFCGWEIYLVIPNGGILGAAIKRGKSLIYLLDSESLRQNLFADRDWHLNQARAKILDLNSQFKSKKKNNTDSRQLSLF